MAAMQPASEKWRRLASRMQLEACNQKGYAIIQIQVLVGPSGDPIFWLSPKMDKIEPIQDSHDFLTGMMARLKAEMPPFDGKP